MSEEDWLDDDDEREFRQENQPRLRLLIKLNAGIGFVGIIGYLEYWWLGLWLPQAIQLVCCWASFAIATHLTVNYNGFEDMLEDDDV